MAKPLKSAEILPFPPPPSGPKKPPTNKKSWALLKAHNAFHNAKGRCNNPNNKDFGAYGGKGTKFLLKSLDELISAIGLPPTKEHTLDRTNAFGHYEVGNIRWANKAAQATNKKHSHGAAFATVAELTAMYEAEAAAPVLRENALGAWNRVLRGIARRHFTEDDVEWLVGTKITPDAFGAGWELGQDRDLAQPASFFQLPSLTWPGETIRLRGGPFPAGIAAPSWTGTVILPRFGGHPC